MNASRQMVTHETITFSKWQENQILKRYPVGAPPGQAEAEAKQTQAARAAGLRVPEVIDVVELEGQQGLILERIAGETMQQEMITRPNRLIPLARQLAELHVAVHRCSGSGLRRQNGRLQQQIEQSPRYTDGYKTYLLDQLAQMPAGNALCHGHFHPQNIILSPDGPVILNWHTATQGEALADVARTIILIQPLPLWADMLSTRRHFTTATLLMFHAMYLKRYRELRPISAPQLNHWQLLAAAARLTEIDAESVENFTGPIQSS